MTTKTKKTNVRNNAKHTTKAIDKLGSAVVTSAKLDSADIDTRMLDGTVPTEIDPRKEAEPKVYHVCQVVFPHDGQMIQKRFLAEKLPTHAVLTTFVKTGQNHVLTFSRDEKLCEAHIRRIKKQYCGDEATKIPNYYDSDKIYLVQVQDLGMQTSELDPNVVEDKQWMRVRNAKARLALEAMRAGSITAFSALLARNIISLYC